MKLIPLSGAVKPGKKLTKGSFIKLRTCAKSRAGKVLIDKGATVEILKIGDSLATVRTIDGEQYKISLDDVRYQKVK